MVTLYSVARLLYLRLGGTVAVLLERNGGGSGSAAFDTERLLPTKPEFGEIYSMTLDGGRLLTSHSRNVTTIQVSISRNVAVLSMYFHPTHM